MLTAKESLNRLKGERMFGRTNKTLIYYHQDKGYFKNEILVTSIDLVGDKNYKEEKFN